MHGGSPEIEAVLENTVKSPELTDTSLLLSEIRLLQQEVCDLKQQNADIGLQLCDVPDALNLKLEELNERIGSKYDEILLFKDTIRDFQHSLDIAEQRAMRPDLKIMGIPEENMKTSFIFQY